MSEPVTLQPLSYATPPPRRPGMLTAIGVLSIILGSLGIIANGIGTLYGVGFYFIAQTSAAMMAAQPPAAVAPITPGAATLPAAAPVPEPTQGLSATERQVVVSALGGVRRLNADRTEQLDTLLAEFGAMIIGDASSPQAVAAAVTESGRDAVSSDDYFVLPQGRLNVGDYDASFRAADGTLVQLTLGEIIDATGQRFMPVTHVDAVTTAIGSTPGVTLTPAQAAALRAELRTPGQSLASPLPSSASTAAQVGATSLSNGQIMVLDNAGGSLTLAPSGTVVNRTGNPLAGLNVFANLSLTSTFVMIVSSLVELALAIYLLVIGILALRLHPRTVGLHTLFAWLKIPLVLITSAAGLWMAHGFMSGFMSNMPGGPAPSSMLTPLLPSVFIAIALGLAYPVGLLIALRSRSIRDYFALTGGVPPLAQAADLRDTMPGHSMP